MRSIDDEARERRWQDGRAAAPQLARVLVSRFESVLPGHKVKTVALRIGPKDPGGARGHYLDSKWRRGAVSMSPWVSSVRRGATAAWRRVFRSGSWELSRESASRDGVDSSKRRDIEGPVPKWVFASGLGTGGMRPRASSPQPDGNRVVVGGVTGFLGEGSGT